MTSPNLWYFVVGTVGVMLGLLIPLPKVAANGGISIPPAQVRAGLSAVGQPELVWWQTSNADTVILVVRSGVGEADRVLHTFSESVPGWHRFPLEGPVGVHAQYWISEFYAGDWLGYYGAYRFEPAKTYLPTIGRR